MTSVVTEVETERLRAAAIETLGMPIALGTPIVDATGALVHAPVDALDCVGVLLDRATDCVHVLGSAVSLETYVWAHAKGFRLEAPNTLAITKVHDRDATLEVMKAAYTARYVRHEVEPFLAKLPLELELDWPASALLLEALRATQAFDYEVNT